MSTHSAILGGSNAERLLKCRASYQELLRSPLDDSSSVYAEEGSMLHENIAFCVRNRITAALLRRGGISFQCNDEQIETLAKALDALEDLKAQYGGKWRIIALETYLPLPGVPGSGGTVDLILTNGEVILIVDWKFGQGVPVFAIYNRGDYDEINFQLGFYGICARHRHARMFRGKRIILAVIQPRLAPPLTQVETSHEELDELLDAFKAAYVEALGRNPHRERGDHCRFAACKATCELWTGPVLELAILDPARAALQASADDDPAAFGVFLDRALLLGTVMETWNTEIRRQAHAFIEAGGKVPNWKLVAKRATRQWVDPITAVGDLIAVGADSDDIFTEPELRSVAQVEKRLKKRGLAIPGEIFHAVSTGTTLAPADDARSEASADEISEELREALLALA